MRTLVTDLGGALRVTRGARSRTRLCADFIALRVVRLARIHPSNNVRKITLADGAPLYYRLNRGDLQSLREVWIDEIYRPPMPIRPDVVVDLGANIGLTTRWLYHRFGSKHLIAVEASAANNALLRCNVPQHTEVLSAAVGPTDGTALFSAAHASNLGRVADVGDAIPQISLASVLALLPTNRRVDLLKLDIEGGEQALLTSGDLGWIDRVDAIIAEFHPEVVDYVGLVNGLAAKGFTYVAAGAAWPGSMDAFYRSS